MLKGQKPAKKKASGMSRQAKDAHNRYQRNYTAQHPEKKRAANRAYWERKKREKA